MPVSSRQKSLVAAWLVLCAGLLLSVLSTLEVKRGIEKEAERYFDFFCDQVTLKIQERFAAYTLMLRGSAALFAGTGTVSREDWRSYVEALQAPENFPGVQGIGFSQVVPPDRLARHIGDIRRQGFPDYTVHPAGARSEYTSVVLIEPFRGANLRAFGFDMFSEPVRQAAMQEACDTDKAVLSGKVKLLTSSEMDPQAGVLMYVPVYRHGMPRKTAEQRRAALIGWTYSLYRMGDLMNGILGDWNQYQGNGVDLHIYDGLQATPASRLFDSDNRQVDSPRPGQLQRTIDLGGRQWLLVFDRIAPISGITYAPAWITLLVGVLLSGLLFGLIRSIIDTRISARRIAGKLTEEIVRREKLLQESKFRWKFAVEGSGDGLWDWNVAEGTVFFSRRWKEILGFSDDEIGCSLDEWQRRIHPDDRADTLAAWHDYLAGNTVAYRCEYRLRGKSGDYIWILARGLVVSRSQEGRVLRVIGTHGDISERKRSQLQLRDALHFQESILNAAPCAIIATTPDGIISLYSKGAERMLGYTADEMVGRHSVAVLHDAQELAERGAGPGSSTAIGGSEEFEVLVGKARRGQVNRNEWTLVREDGTRLSSLISSVALYDADGAVSGFLGIAVDISERKQAEDALKASEIRFCNLLKDIPSVAIQAYGADGVIRYWNPASEALYGYSEAEAIGRNLFELIVPPEVHAYAREMMRKTFASGEPSMAEECTLIRKDGTKVDVISSHAYVHVPGLSPEMFCVHVDLSERKRAEAALRQREQYQRALLDNFPFMVWLKDSESRFLAVNLAFATGFGWPSTQSLIGRTDLDITPPDLAAAYRADDRAVLASGVSKHVEELIETGGQRRWFETYKSPISVDGCAVGTVGFARDITEYKQNEAALRAAMLDAEKANHAKSRFLAAASHDLRQPLAALSLYIGVLRKTMSPDGIALVGHIEDCVDSLSELLTDLLDVSKLDAGVIAPALSDFAIDEVLASLVSVHAAEAELKGLALRLRRSDAIVHSDPVLLRRILGNFLANAIRYTNSGGVLIACRRHQGRLWIEVWDTGIGIAEENTEIIFEEFRQLGDNSRNRGSGLGLAIVTKTAQLLGLEIRLHSKPGRGSMFAIELQPGRTPGGAGAALPRSPSRPLRIGLVEDNSCVLQALVLALGNDGDEVLAASTASGLFERLGGVRPDIVISDYRLKGTETGFDVVEQARTLFGEDLPAVLITGDTDPALIRSMADRGIAVHYKPLKIEVLWGFIRDVTERRSS